MNLARNLILLVLIIETASAVTFLANTSDGEMLFSNEDYTFRLDVEERRMTIGNMFTVYTVPVAEVLGEDIEPLEPTIGAIEPGQEVDEYHIGYPAGFKRDVYISSRITLKDRYIQHEITVENTHGSELEVKLRLSPSTNESYYVYAPFVANPSNNYMWISPTFNQEKGMGVAIYFDSNPSEYVQVAEISLEKNPVRFLQWNLLVPSGQTEKISMKYIVGYVSDEILMQQHAFNPPSNKQHVLDTATDPLFELENPESLKEWRSEISASSAVEVVEKTKAKLDTVVDSPAMDTFLTTTRFNFQELVGKSQMNSLEKALVFREIVRKKGIPAELHLGSKAGPYYAWVEAYPTIEPVTYDPAGKMNEYEQVYSDPSPPYCNGEITSCKWNVGLRQDEFCIFNFCASIYLFTVIVLIGVIGLFLFLQYKAELFYKYTDKGKKKEGNEIGRSYEIINDGFEPTNPLEGAVFGQLKKRMGQVELERYEKETGFSAMLIKTGIEELEEKGVIRKL